MTSDSHGLAPQRSALVLGIESSCDETAAAVVDTEGRVFSDVVASQIDEHRPYGGVVPELASRAHLRSIGYVIERALAPIDGGLDRIDAIAVTNGPGLSGALLVGVQTAKALAFSRSLPLVAVDHLHAHLLAVFLKRTEGAPLPTFPFVALLVSGGHTALYEVTSPLDARLVSQTRDDAAGEAFDKVGKMLGLAYPAGALIDRLAQQGDPAAIAFPRALRMRSSLDFSFSGVKTAVLTHLEKHGVPTGQALADLCASFQEAVCDSLVTKTLRAAQAAGRQRVVLGGGVAANGRLRALMADRGRQAGCEVHLPPTKLCTDNGAMIALAGAYAFQARGAAPWTLNADAAWRM